MNTSDCYFYLEPETATVKIYRLCEDPDGDGWMVCWHKHTGTDQARQQCHPVKKLGHFESIEDAQPALDKLAAKLGMKFWREYPEPTQSGITGEWIRAAEAE